MIYKNEDLQNLKNELHKSGHYDNKLEEKLLELDNLINDLSGILPYNFNVELQSDKQTSDFKWIANVFNISKNNEEISKELYHAYPHSSSKVKLFIKYFNILKSKK